KQAKRGLTGMPFRYAADENRSATPRRFFIAIGITCVILGAVMWFGQPHFSKLPAHEPADEQMRQQTQQSRTNGVRGASTQENSASSEVKQAAVEHCRRIPGIRAWLACMEREGVNTRDLLETGSVRQELRLNTIAPETTR